MQLLTADVRMFIEDCLKCSSLTWGNFMFKLADNLNRVHLTRATAADLSAEQSVLARQRNPPITINRKFWEPLFLFYFANYGYDISGEFPLSLILTVLRKTATFFRTLRFNSNPTQGRGTNTRFRSLRTAHRDNRFHVQILKSKWRVRAAVASLGNQSCACEVQNS